MRNRQLRKLLPVIVGIVVLLVVVLLGTDLRNLVFQGTVLEQPDPPFPRLSIQPGKTDETQNSRSAPWVSIPVDSRNVCVDWVAYHTNQDGYWSIYRADVNGEPTANVSLTSVGSNTTINDSLASIMPSRSPDGKWIAFASNRDGNWEIYVSKVDGSLVQRVSNNASATEINPMWSPNGRYILYETTRHGNWDIYMVDVTDGTEICLTSGPSNETNAYWSPDGSKFLYVSDADLIPEIYEMDTTSKQSRRVSDGIGEDTDPVYSSDGSQVLFTSKRGTANNVVYTMNLDGSNMKAISDPAMNSYNAVWASDVNSVAYEAHSKTSDGKDLSMIEVYDPVSGKTRAMTDKSDNSYSPTWICGGAKLAFTSEVNKNADIFAADAMPIDNGSINLKDRKSVRQLTISTLSDRYPQNSPSKDFASRRAMLPQ